MKERIEDLIESYDRKLKALEEMSINSTDYQTTLRLDIKKGVYHSVIRDLKLLLDED